MLDRQGVELGLGDGGSRSLALVDEFWRCWGSPLLSATVFSLGWEECASHRWERCYCLEVDVKPSSSTVGLLGLCGASDGAWGA